MFHTTFAEHSLRGSLYKCDKHQLLEMAKKLKSPNTIYYVVSVLSLKTSVPPDKVAECLGVIWKPKFN